MLLKHWVSCEPVAKGRPRFAKVCGNVKVFTPKKTLDYEELVRASVSSEFSLNASPDSLLVKLEFHMPIPKSWSKAKKLHATSGKLRHVSKPDVDNLAKAVLDALKGLVFVDDSQITGLAVRKSYSETPGVNISIWRDDK